MLGSDRSHLDRSNVVARGALPELVAPPCEERAVGEERHAVLRTSVDRDGKRAGEIGFGADDAEFQAKLEALVE